MATKVLTPLAVKAAKPKRNVARELVRAEYPDRGCAGLYLIVQPSGLKSWALRFRFGGKTRKLTLGAVADHEARSTTSSGVMSSLLSMTSPASAAPTWLTRHSPF